MQATKWNIRINRASFFFGGNICFAYNVNWCGSCIFFGRYLTQWTVKKQTIKSIYYTYKRGKLEYLPKKKGPLPFCIETRLSRILFVFLITSRPVCIEIHCFFCVVTRRFELEIYVWKGFLYLRGLWSGYLSIFFC